MQGISLLANCFRDAKLVVDESKRINAWIDTL